MLNHGLREVGVIVITTSVFSSNKSKQLWTSTGLRRGAVVGKLRNRSNVPSLSWTHSMACCQASHSGLVSLAMCPGRLMTSAPRALATSAISASSVETKTCLFLKEFAPFQLTRQGEVSHQAIAGFFEEFLGASSSKNKSKSPQIVTLSPCRLESFFFNHFYYFNSILQ